jgi:membrane protease YdiL (CAAX protease family)
MPTALDIAFAVLFAVVIAAFDSLYYSRRIRAHIAAGVPDARLKAYRRTTFGQWAIAAIAVVLWAQRGRPWRGLWLAPSRGLPLEFAGGLMIGIIVIGSYQVRSVRRLTPDQARSVRGRFGSVEFLLPHTPNELHWFMALSVTAGICEELLYRGYLTWLVAFYLGLPAAVAVVAVAFGAAHAYQGMSGVVKTGFIGLAMSAIVLTTGWLVSAMFVHSLIDLSSGFLGYTVINSET